MEKREGKVHRGDDLKLKPNFTTGHGTWSALIRCTMLPPPGELTSAAHPKLSPARLLKRQGLNNTESLGFLGLTPQWETKYPNNWNNLSEPITNTHTHAHTRTVMSLGFYDLSGF